MCIQHQLVEWEGDNKLTNRLIKNCLVPRECLVNILLYPEAVVSGEHLVDCDQDATAPQTIGLHYPTGSMNPVSSQFGSYKESVGVRPPSFVQVLVAQWETRTQNVPLRGEY